MRLNRRRAYAATAVLLLLLALIVILQRRQPEADDPWLIEFVKIDNLLATLETRTPQDTTPHLWKTGVDRLRAGFSNACHSQSRVSEEQLQRLYARLEPIVRQETPAFGDLVEIWDLIGESSEMAHEHIVVFRSDFLAFLSIEDVNEK